MIWGLIWGLIGGLAGGTSRPSRALQLRMEGPSGLRVTLYLSCQLTAGAVGGRAHTTRHQRMKKRALAAASLLLAGGCAPRTIDSSAELLALREAATAYHEAAMAKEVDEVVALYDEAAIMVPPNADLVEGLEGVR